MVEPCWKIQSGGYSIPKGREHIFHFEASEAHFNGKEPGIYTAAVEFSHNSVNGEHTVLVNLIVKGDTGSNHANNDDNKADQIPDDLEELAESPRFIAGLASGGALVLSSFCFFFCLWTCICKRCCSGRKANLERRGAGKFQRVGDTDGGGDVEMSSATKTNSASARANPVSNLNAENSFGITLDRTSSKPFLEIP